MHTRFRRRPASMTSLIDVIFLLLMFFMLASTFTRTAEIPLVARAAGGGGFADSRLVFLRLGPDGLSLNGKAVAEADLASRLTDLAPETPRVLISMSEGVSAQRLTDLLVALRAITGIEMQVLG